MITYLAWYYYCLRSVSKGFTKDEMKDQLIIVQLKTKILLTFVRNNEKIYKSLFKFIKNAFMALLSFSGSLSTKCLNDV